MYIKLKEALLVGGALMSVSSVYGGGEVSKIGGAVLLGAATGGVGLALGAPVMVAATAGTAAAIGAATGGRTRAGISINAAGQPSVRVNVSDNYGHNIVNLGADYRGLHPANGSSITDSSGARLLNEAASRIAKEKFSNWSRDTVYDLITVNGNEYCRAKSSSEEFLTLGITCGWSKTTRDLIGTQRFENQPWNLTFETTPYQWYFDIVMINGKRYNHAYSDSLSDFLVPEGERHTICAPKSFVEQYKLEQENKRKQASLYASLSEKKAAAKRAEDHSTEFAKAFFNDSQSSIYGAAYYARQCQINREREAQNLNMARKLAQGAVEYYQAAVSVAESVNLGPLMEAAVAFVLPGGIENVQSFAAGNINAIDFLTNIGRDIGQDFAVSLVTSGFGGFSNRLKKVTLRTASSAVEKVSKTPMKTVAASRVTRIFGHGTFWDSLISEAQNLSLRNLKNKSPKRLEIRTDGKYYYQFDPAHKTDKIHLHKYQKVGSNKFKLIEEIDPEDGHLIRPKTDGVPETWG